MKAAIGRRALACAVLCCCLCFAHIGGCPSLAGERNGIIDPQSEAPAGGPLAEDWPAVAKAVLPRLSDIPSTAQAPYLPSALRSAAAGLATRQAAERTAALAATTDTERAKRLPPPDPKLHPLGLIPAPPVKPPAAEAVLEAIRAERTAKAAKEGPAVAPFFSPPSHDNSAGLPAVGDQGAQNSCASWATGYYIKTYQEGRERSWSLADPAHQFSPAFLYNQLQYFDEGSTMQDNFDLLTDQGCASLAAMPCLDTDYRTWPSAAAYREGIPYRAQSYDYLGHGETFQIFDAVKAIISSGDLCVVGIPVYRPGPTAPGRFDLLTATDYEYDLPPASDIYLAGYHALAIVGYDESKFGGTGGYKIVNSWGTGWGNHGFAWISERFLTTFGFDFHRMTDRLGYVPAGLLHWKVSHSYWGWNYDNVTVRVGIGPTNAPLWTKTIVTQLERDSLTIDMWYDISDAAVYLPPDWSHRWWISVTDNHAWHIGTVHICDIEYNSQMYSGSTPLPFVTSIDKGTFYSFVPCGEAASRNYYVNDDYDPAKDIYCSAPGNDANDGLTPATPKRTLQSVLDRYTLKGGDTVWVDAGVYPTTTTVVVSYLDTGNATQSLRIVGPSGRSEARFQVTPGIAGFNLFYSRNVALENLHVQGGTNGVASKEPRSHLLRNLTISGCSSDAISLIGEYYEGYYEMNAIEHCIVYGASGSCVYVEYTVADVDQCTLVAKYRGTCLEVHDHPYHYHLAYANLANSILVAQNGTCNAAYGFARIYSDYNDLFAPGGATGDTGEWDIYLEPLFADSGNGDVHLRSKAGRWDPSASAGAGGWVIDIVHSPCIDSGSLLSPVGDEPPPNGYRVNLGAYGGTAFASKSASARYITLLTPTVGSTYRTECNATWQTLGAGWQGHDTVQLQYSPNNGTDWHVVDGGGSVPFNGREFLWNVTSLSSGTLYRMRIVCNEEPAVAAETPGTFTISPLFGRTYYVNDASTSNDVYCIAPGNDAYDGLTSATPKASVQAVIDTYTLRGGDVVLIDTGHYDLTSDIVLTDADKGTYSAPIAYLTFRGSTHSAGTTLDRNSSTSSCIALASGTCFRFENLRISGGRDGIRICDSVRTLISHCQIVSNSRYGIYLPDTGSFSGHFVEVDHSVVAGNGQGEIRYEGDWVADPTNLWITNCSIVANNHAAIYFYPSDGLRIRNSILVSTGINGQCLNLYSMGCEKCDYNDLFTSGGAIIGASGFMGYNGTYRTLFEWQAASWQDLHSISCDPQFMHIGSDFHLQSTGGRWNPSAGGGLGGWEIDPQSSPCIDAGDPNAPVGYEPEENGDRINIGAYGGTTEASKSPAGRRIKLILPETRQPCRGIVEVRWFASGAGYASSETLRIEVSTDSATTWNVVPNASALPFWWGRWGWDTTRHLDSGWARIRLVSNQDEMTSDSVRVCINNYGLRYYVNDASTSGDFYCAGPGSDSNDGLTSATPKASLQNLLATYDLEGSDTIYVDTGYYLLTSNVTFSLQDNGEMGRPVRLIGSPRRPVLDRNGRTVSGSKGLDVQCEYIEINGFEICNAQAGISMNLDAVAYSENSSVIRNCRIHDCDEGIYATASWAAYKTLLIERNVLKDNSLGIRLDGSFDWEPRVSHNIVIGNGNSLNLKGVPIASWGKNGFVRHNIFWAQGSGHVCFEGDYATDNSDWNDIRATNGARVSPTYATLADWQAAGKEGPHSFFADPLFADVASGDYHLRSSAGRWDPLVLSWATDTSTSLCIDAGDPATPVGQEPNPNGARINIGVYGGTAEASKSPTTRSLTVLSPNGGEIWKGIRTIRWRALGTAWLASETVRIEYSPNRGLSWLPIPGADSLAYNAESFSWDTAAATPNAGLSFFVRITCNSHPSVTDISDYAFTLHNQGLHYYVNDASTTNDVYCLVPGNDSNDGLTSATPKTTIQAIIDTYELASGDCVYIDTGIYVLSSPITIGNSDSGDSSGRVHFIGSTHTSGTLINRNNPGWQQYAVVLTSSDYVTIQRLNIRGAGSGIYVDNANNCLIEDCRLFHNSYYGIKLYDCSSVTIHHNLLDNNGTGISSWASVADVSFNTVVQNRQGVSDVSGTLRHNVVYSYGNGSSCIRVFGAIGVISDYNCLYAGGGAAVSRIDSNVVYSTLSEWQLASGRDQHSISCNPLFVDPDGPDNVAGNADDDFHLQSTAGSWHGGTWTLDTSDSLCIDMGDPMEPVGLEPQPNGGRVNLGAYGGTIRASKSPAIRRLVLIKPNGGEVCRGTVTIEWATVGSAWRGADSVTLHYSANGGVDWTPIAAGGEIPAQHGEWGWDLAGLTSGTQYRVKVVCDQDSSVCDVSDRSFSIQATRRYFVNDSSTSGDVYCVAPGNSANDGLTSGTPKASLQAVLNLYDIEPGDRIFVDAGIYSTTATILMGSADGGSVEAPVQIIGVPHKTVFSGNGSVACLTIQAPYLSLSGCAINGGSQGVVLSGAHVTLSDCTFRDHVQNAIYVATAGKYSTIQSCIIHHQGTEGSFIDGSGYAIEYYYNEAWYATAQPAVLANNTIAGTLGVNAEDLRQFQFRNNIVWTSGTGGRCFWGPYWSDVKVGALCDYNDFVTTSGAKFGVIHREQPSAHWDVDTLADWRIAMGTELHGQMWDPMFVNPANQDYHLKSTEGRWDPMANGGAGGWVRDSVNSPCIDAGDPADSVGAEPMPNGGRINIGAYGGTAEASKSPASGRWLVFEGAGNRDPLHAWEPIRWSARGANWATSDTVRLECSPDAGQTWLAIAGAGSLSHGAGHHWWDSRTVPDGDRYRFRVVANGAPVTSGTATRNYSVHNLQAPWGPTPADSATNVSIQANLSWRAANGATSYDIYLWPSSQSKPTTPTQSAIMGLMYDPPLSLLFGTTYRWQVVARNSGCSTPGPEWTFTTEIAPRTLYVSATTGNDSDGDGSQARPFATIGFALGEVTGSATTSYTILVADGIYRETVTMQFYEDLYGGYDPADWTRHVERRGTIIDGENTRCCVIGASNATLDGFVLRNGRATDGGGFYTTDGSPTVRNCLITSCAATRNGGGIFARFYGTPQFVNCWITSCSAGVSGGGAYVYYTNARMLNCLIAGCRSVNSASIYTDNTSGYSARIINCTVFGNQGGIRTGYEAGAQITNSVLWNNGDDINGYTASHVWNCDIEDGDFLGTNGNISSDPLFANPAIADFHILAGSPCIDAGTTVGAPATDLDGAPRPRGPGIDIGCYEWDPALPARPSNPSPADGATTVPIATDLRWDVCVRAQQYDLLLWQSQGTRPSSPTVPGLVVTQYDPPGDLQRATTYRWQVVAKNTAGATTGPIWTFTTPLYGLRYAGQLLDDDTTPPSYGDGDGYVEPGETVEVWVDLFNRGDLNAVNVAGTFAIVAGSSATLVSSHITWPDIPTSATRRSSIPLVLAIASNCTTGTKIILRGTVDDSNPAYGPWDIELTTITVELRWSIRGTVRDANTSAPIAGAQVVVDGMIESPGATAYWWTDSDQPGGPMYSWGDIIAIGTRLAISGDDRNLGPLSIGFGFPFYGTNYTQYRVCTNGWITFSPTFSSSPYNNYRLPSTSAPPLMVAALWDDLNVDGSSSVYAWSDGSSKFVLSFINVARLGSSNRYTFQIILNANGVILLQYQSLTAPNTGCTVGIQNANGTQGLTVVSHAAYLHNSLAVRIAAGVPVHRTTLTSADGTYAIHGLHPSTYTVTASKSPYSGAIPTQQNIGLPPDASGVNFRLTSSQISVTPTSFTFTVRQGQMAQQLLWIRNSGSANLVWSLREAPVTAWLSESRTSGTVVPSGQTSTTITANSAGLGLGFHQALILADSNDIEDPVTTVPVTLRVLDATSPTAPGRPAPDLAPFTSRTAVTFTWTPAADPESGIAYYWCQVGTSPGGNDSLNSNAGTALTTTVVGADGQTLYCRVRACNADGLLGPWSADSTPATIDVSPPTPPGTPFDIGAFTSSSAVRFDWTTASDIVSGIASYDLQVGTTPGGSDIFNGNVGNVLTRTVTGANGQTLYARVRGRDRAGNVGAWSGNSDGILVDLTPPQSAVNPLPRKSSNPIIALTWSGSDSTSGSGIRDYTIYVSTNPGPFTAFCVNTPATSGTYVGQPGNTYGFYSIARDNVGHVETAPTTADATVEIVQPNLVVTPTSLSVTSPEGDALTTRTLQIANGTTYGTVLTYTIATTPTWLTCQPTTGSSTGQVTTHTVTMDPAGLNAGDYAGTITITSAQAGNTTVSVPVRLRITNVLPTVTIATVAPNPAQPPSDNIVFEGSASDAAGSITAVVWWSDLDGPLSTQEHFSKSADELTVGNHAIAFIAWDDEGASSTVATILTIRNALPTARIVSVLPNPVAAGATVTLTVSGQDHDETGQSLVDGELTWPDGIHSAILPGVHLLAAPTTGPQRTIWYRVRDDEDSWSTSSSATLDIIAVRSPVIASEPPYTRGTTNRITWGGVVGWSGYCLQWSPSAQFAPVLGESGWTTATAFVVSALSNGQMYYYRAKSRNVARVESAWSNVVNSCQDATTPTRPGIPRDGGDWTSLTQVRFDWSPSTDGTSGSGVASYVLRVGTWIGGRNIFEGNVGNATFHPLAVTTSGLTLYARVRALDNVGYLGAWSDSSNGITVDTVRPRLTSLAVRDQCTLQLTFDEPVRNADKIANYSCARGIRILGVLSLSATQYRIYTAEQRPGTSYTLTIRNLTDRAGNPLNPSPCSRAFTGGRVTRTEKWHLYR